MRRPLCGLLPKMPYRHTTPAPSAAAPFGVRSVKGTNGSPDRGRWPTLLGLGEMSGFCLVLSALFKAVGSVGSEGHRASFYSVRIVRSAGYSAFYCSFLGVRDVPGRAGRRTARQLRSGLVEHGHHLSYCSAADRALAARQLTNSSLGSDRAYSAGWQPAQALPPCMQRRPARVNRRVLA